MTTLISRKKNCGNYSIEKNRENKVDMDDLDFVKTTLISREKNAKNLLDKKSKTQRISTIV